MWVEQLEQCWDGEKHVMRQCSPTVTHTVTLSLRKVERLLIEALTCSVGKNKT